jgi:hypothetical protein
MRPPANYHETGQQISIVKPTKDAPFSQIYFIL